jgi:deoxyribonuclease IV
MNIGAHVSISGGIDLSIERGKQIGATAIQTFASPPRTLKFFPYDSAVIDRYIQARAASPIQTHVFHAVYLVNLANERLEYVQASMDSLVAYQTLAGTLGVLGTVFHVGSHKGNGFETVKLSVAEAIAEIVKQSPDNTVLMLENAAGHNGTIGQTLDELVYLIKTAVELGAAADKIGLCLDTQHAFVSGVDGRDKTLLDNYLHDVDSRIGLDFLKVIHVNDSKFDFDAHRDRHENIGSGFLGNAGISNWINHPKLKRLPFILEVPGRDGKGPGKQDVDELRSLAA